MTSLLSAQERLPNVFARERAGLVRLCARLTGAPEAAEDLAQETLLEAWRHRHALRQPDRLEAWLAGIARNVCLRWARARHRDGARELAQPVDAPDAPPALELALTDACDLEVDLERQELVTLLDRALALLPRETRVALVAHYVDESPLAEIAARLGVNASAVAMRLQRGKVALRRVLANELADEMAAFRVDGEGVWEETPLWCAWCGRRHLEGRFHRAEGEWWLRCPGCNAGTKDVMIHTRSRDILGGVKSYKRAYERLWAWANAYYPPRLRERRVPCTHCGRAIPLLKEYPGLAPFSHDTEQPMLVHYCSDCDALCYESLNSLVLAHPVGRAFERRHQRVRVLPRATVEAQGRPAIITTFESLSGSERLVGVNDADTFELLRIDGGQAEGGA